MAPFLDDQVLREARFMTGAAIEDTAKQAVSLDMMDSVDKGQPTRPRNRSRFALKIQDLD